MKGKADGAAAVVTAAAPPADLMPVVFALRPPFP